MNTKKGIQERMWPDLSAPCLSLAPPKKWSPNHFDHPSLSGKIVKLYIPYILKTNIMFISIMKGIEKI